MTLSIERSPINAEYQIQIEPRNRGGSAQMRGAAFLPIAKGRGETAENFFFKNA